MPYDITDPAAAHRLQLEGREKLTVSGVEDVERFDDQCIVLRTGAGVLVVSGESLHIGKLSLDGGELHVDGRIDALTYEDAPEVRGYSFTTEVSSMGKVPSSTLVDFAVEVPKPTVCEKMELREGTPVYCFTRVRNVDGEPLILETSYYPQYIYPNLTRDMLQTHSFYSLLYHVGIVPFAADESYEAVILDDSCAALLGVPSGSCAFFHQRLTRTEDGRIYEYTRSYIRGDRVRLDVHMQKSGMNFVRTID